MTSKFSLVAALAAAMLLPAVARADIPVVKTADTQLNLGGTIQTIALAQRVDDPVREDGRLFLFLNRARLRTNGHYKDFSFNMEMALGGEETVIATTGISLSLLDFSANIPLFGTTNYIKVGQFKVPYGRERLTYSGQMQFLERSVEDLGFRVGRDVGVTLNLNPGPLTVIAGVFTGGGRDAPQRYLPEFLGIPLLSFRAGVGNVDDDSYALHNDLDVKETKTAFFVNGLWTKDTRVGHSTALNIKFADKSLLLNPNWNPYIAKSPLKAGIWWQVGADAALRTPVGPGSLSAEAQVDWASYSNDYGVAHTAGGRAQAGYYINKLEIALRYSVLFPDNNFFNGATQITKHDPIHEITPSIAYYLSGQSLKLVADLPINIDHPVFTEAGVGSYVAYEQVDQASILSKPGNTVARQNVVEARLMLQAAF